MRAVLFEKYNPTYIDQNGTSIWTNKYGDIIKRIDKEGKEISLLKFGWNAEVMQDLIALQGFDMVSELETALINQLTQEINRSILNDVVHMGTTNNFDGQTNTLNINMRFVTENVVTSKVINTTIIHNM